jgi:hypothetical protein
MALGIAFIAEYYLVLLAKLKKLPEHSQSVERCGRFEKDLNVEGCGSIT